MGGEGAFSRRFVFVLPLAPFSSPRNITAFLSKKKKNHGPKATIIDIYALPVRVLFRDNETDNPN